MRRLFSLAVLVAAAGCSRGEEKTASPRPSTTAAPQVTSARPESTPAERCEGAKKRLRDFVATFPATCAKDADCDGYFLLEDTCAGPTVLRVPGSPPENKPLLFAYQDDVRKSCPSRPTCEPGPYRASCAAGRCVDTLERTLPP